MNTGFQRDSFKGVGFGKSSRSETTFPIRAYYSRAKRFHDMSRRSIVRKKNFFTYSDIITHLDFVLI